MDEAIRSILVKHGRFPTDISEIDEKDDLFRAGMTSHASVNVMLALEEEFDVEFPESMLRRSTFESVYAIRKAVSELVGDADAPKDPS